VEMSWAVKSARKFRRQCSNGEPGWWLVVQVDGSRQQRAAACREPRRPGGHRRAPSDVRQSSGGVASASSGSASAPCRLAAVALRADLIRIGWVAGQHEGSAVGKSHRQDSSPHTACTLRVAIEYRPRWVSWSPIERRNQLTGHASGSTRPGRPSWTPAVALPVRPGRGSTRSRPLRGSPAACDCCCRRCDGPAPGSGHARGAGTRTRVAALLRSFSRQCGKDRASCLQFGNAGRLHRSGYASCPAPTPGGERAGPG
jgi:hypothetical protein